MYLLQDPSDLNTTKLRAGEVIECRWREIYICSLAANGAPVDDRHRGRLALNYKSDTVSKHEQLTEKGSLQNTVIFFPQIGLL